MKAIKKFFRENRFTSELYLSLARIKSAYILRRNKRQFIKNSIRTMEDVQKTLSGCELITNFFFMFGTLLGAYRDKKLLKNDMDIDVGVYLSVEQSHESFRKYMKSHGFALTHFYAISDDVIQDTYRKNDVNIDIALLGKTDSYDYCYLMYNKNNEEGNVLMFPFAKVNEIKSYQLGDILINIPENVEQYLSDTYGGDWRTPNPNYKYWENPKAKKVNLTADITICSKGV